MCIQAKLVYSTMPPEISIRSHAVACIHNIRYIRIITLKTSDYWTDAACLVTHGTETWR